MWYLVGWIIIILCSGSSMQKLLNFYVNEFFREKRIFDEQKQKICVYSWQHTDSAVGYC